MAALTLLLTDALPLTASLLIVAIVAWPHPRVRRHRISNYFFLRRIRAQERSHTLGGSDVVPAGRLPRTPAGTTRGGAWPPGEVEAAPPLGAAVHHPGAAAPPQTPVDAGSRTGCASTGLSSAGAGAGHPAGNPAPAGPKTVTRG